MRGLFFRKRQRPRNPHAIILLRKYNESIKKRKEVMKEITKDQKGRDTRLWRGTAFLVDIALMFVGLYMVNINLLSPSVNSRTFIITGIVLTLGGVVGHAIWQKTNMPAHTENEADKE